MVEIRDKIERRPIGSLIPYARNARTHSDAQIQQIAASMREWGWTNPVLVDEAGGIIAGHGRVLAAQRLQVSEVPVIVASGWTDAQKRAYIIADNKLALNAGWDNDLLALEFGELQELGFDLDLTGFDAGELEALAGSEENDVHQRSTAREVDADAFEMEHKCPRCGFEYETKTRTPGL